MVRRLNEILGISPSAELITEDQLLESEKQFENGLRWLELVIKRELREERELEEQMAVPGGNPIGASSPVHGQGAIDTPERPTRRKKPSRLFRRRRSQTKKQSQSAPFPVEERMVLEHLSPPVRPSPFVRDFVYSTNRRFKGKSKEERIRMGLGAYYRQHRRGG